MLSLNKVQHSGFFFLPCWNRLLILLLSTRGSCWFLFRDSSLALRLLDGHTMRRLRRRSAEELTHSCLPSPASSEQLLAEWNDLMLLSLKLTWIHIITCVYVVLEYKKYRVMTDKQDFPNLKTFRKERKPCVVVTGTDLLEYLAGWGKVGHRASRFHRHSFVNSPPW